MTAQRRIELGEVTSDVEHFVFSGGKERRSIADRYADLDIKEHDDAVGSLMDKLDQILNENNIIAPDLHINDSEIPEMANFFEFCYDPNYGFKTIKPFARQMWMYSKLFGEICPKCTKSKYQDSILSIPVDAKPSYFNKKITLFRWGVCPKCGLHRSKAFKKGKLNIYQELVQICGQRSGKSIGVSFASTYLLHKMLKLQRPAEFYTGLSNVTLVASFVAMSLSSVMTLLWEPIMDAIENSMWFDEYHELLKYYEKKYGIEIYKKKDTYVRYRHRKIFLQPEVPHKGKLRGKTRWLFSIDEMDHMSEDGDKITVSGTKIWEALDRSCLTMRQSAYDYLRSGNYDTILPSMALNVSSPASISGPLFTRFKKNEFSRTVLTVHTPTWEINPKVPRNSEVIVQAYLDDPVMADRDYAAIPPENANPFFTNTGKISACFGTLSGKNKIEYKEIIVRKRDRAYVYPEITGLNTAGVSPNGTILALDAGHSNNSFGMAILQKSQKKIEVIAVIEVMPEKNKTTISQGKIIKKLLPRIIKEFDIRGIVADRWQSLATLSVAEEENPSLLFTEVYSAKYIDFIQFRSSVQDEAQVLFPKTELSEDDCLIPKSDYPEVYRGKPVSHLRNQFSTVVDKLKMVDKGDHRTDDILRAVVLGYRFLMNEKYDKYFKPRKQTNRAIVGTLGGQGSGASVNVTIVKGRVIGASM